LGNGKPNRPIIVTFLRASDKADIMQAKFTKWKTLMEKNIFINNELTDAEAKEAAELRQVARDWKKDNPGIRTKIVRGTIFKEVNGKQTKHRFIDGTITEF